MKAATREILIGHEKYSICMDPDYGKHLGECFEPSTATLLESLCKTDSRVLDIGANIGVTGIAIAQFAPLGKIAAIEPIPAAYDLLKINVANSRHVNLTTHNFALGSKYGEVQMQGNPDNLSGSFVSERHNIDDDFHFTEVVSQHKLDDIFEDLSLDRLDMIKIDVEGYEIDVLEGGASVLSTYKPIVMLEMNYVALNLWRGISLPDFRERLLDIFPCVYAVQGDDFLDFRDVDKSHTIQFDHLTKWSYMDIVAGFDDADLVARLKRLPEIRQRNENIIFEKLNPKDHHIEILQAECDAAKEELKTKSQRIVDIESSISWKITAPMRKLGKLFG